MQLYRGSGDNGRSANRGRAPCDGEGPAMSIMSQPSVRRPREEHLRIRLRPQATGEVSRARFGYDPASVAEPSTGVRAPPKAVVREARLVSPLPRPGCWRRPRRGRCPQDDRPAPTAGARTTGATPASPGSPPANVVEVRVPDERTEAAWATSRALEDAPATRPGSAPGSACPFLLGGTGLCSTTTPTGAAGRTDSRRTGGRGRSSLRRG